MSANHEPDQGLGPLFTLIFIGALAGFWVSAVGENVPGLLFSVMILAGSAAVINSHSS